MFLLAAVIRGGTEFHSHIHKDDFCLAGFINPFIVISIILWGDALLSAIFYIPIPQAVFRIHGVNFNAIIPYFRIGIRSMPYKNGAFNSSPFLLGVGEFCAIIICSIEIAAFIQYPAYALGNDSLQLRFCDTLFHMLLFGIFI